MCRYVVNVSSMNQAVCPLASRRNLHLFERDAPAHQPATHPHRFRFQVVDCRRGADASLLAPGREENIPDGWAGSHPGHPGTGDAIAQQPADGAARDHPHRPRHQLASPVGSNRELAQRFDRCVDGQASVPGDPQIAREIHHRCGVNESAPRIVKVDSGLDWMGGHVQEHHLGGDAGPIGEMREVQSHSHPRRRIRRVRRSRAPAAAVHRPHLEGVDRIVVEPGDRMGGVGGANRYPAALPVDPVLVIGDRRAAVVLRRLPRQRHRPIRGLHCQVCGRARHRLARAVSATTTTTTTTASSTASSSSTAARVWAHRGVAGRGGGGAEAGLVDDGGDAARAGGKGSDVVAGGVLDGVGVVAGGGVGVGDDDGLAPADTRRNLHVQMRENPLEPNETGNR